MPDEPMVTVEHRRKGCPLCGSRDKHQHTWAEWDREVHGTTTED